MNSVLRTVVVALLASSLAIVFASCGDGSDPRRPAGVTAEVSATIATVVTVRWSTAGATTGYVEYGPTRALGSRTPVEAVAGQTHRAILLGLTADTDCYYRAVSADGAAVVTGDLGSIRTGVLPLGLPAITRTGTGQSGFVVVPVLGAKPAVVILDAKGDIVWYWTDARGLDFYRARLSVDGKSLLYNAAKVSGTPAQASELVRVALDGSGSTSVPIPLLAHDFVEHPDGTLAAIAVEYRDFEGVPLAGNKIVEVAPDGSQRTVWSSWDCFDPAVTKGDDMQQGWTFANALDYDPAADVYYLGLRNFSSIVRINRQSRACEWVFGLAGSTFTFATGSSRFLHQHQFQVRGDRVLLIDNDGAPGNESRILEYQLDPVRKIATQVWSYVARPSVYTFVFGEPVRLDDGSTFINWGAAGQLERLDPAGNSTWKLNTQAGFAFGFHSLADSLYVPAPAPAVDGGRPPGGSEGHDGGALVDAAGEGEPDGAAAIAGDDFVAAVDVAVHPRTATVLVVRWTQVRPADGTYLEFSFPGSAVMTSRLAGGAAGAHREVVLGVPEKTAVSVRIVSRAGGVDHKTSPYSGTTGAIPSGMPRPTLVAYDPALASTERWLVGAVEDSPGGCPDLSCYYAGMFWVYIMDRQGNIVWYWADPSSNASHAFPRQARDGEYLVLDSVRGAGVSGVIKLTLDREYLETIAIPGLDDSFDVTAAGSILYDVSGELRELGRDGQTRTLWKYPIDMYCNAITWVPEDDTVLVSLPEPSTTFQIDRKTGTVVGQYGADPGSYAMSPADWRIQFQHAPTITPQGTLLLSTHLPAFPFGTPAGPYQHGFAEFAIDRDRRLLTLAWVYDQGPEWALAKGMALRLANGNTLVNYGTGGVLREVTPDQRTAFEVKFDVSEGDDLFNKMLGGNFFIEDLYALNGGGPR